MRSTSRQSPPGSGQREGSQRDERRNDLCLFCETSRGEERAGREQHNAGTTSIRQRKAPNRQSGGPHFDVELSCSVYDGDTRAEQTDRTDERRPPYATRSQPASQRRDDESDPERIDQPPREEGRRAERSEPERENQYERGVVEHALWTTVPERRIENAGLTP